MIAGKPYRLHANGRSMRAHDCREERSRRWRAPIERVTLKVVESATLPPVIMLLAAFVAISSTCVFQLELAEARYIHSTYRFSPGGELGDGPLVSNSNSNAAAGEQRPISSTRRQDFESDDDEEDNSPAASYRSQDDNTGGGDNYGDNESDGPYEETPVEQEGQADLEKFFDDHLGASDRDGMDKENLPTNLVALLSEPPQLLNSHGLIQAPLAGAPAMTDTRTHQERLANSLTVVPLAPVVNPIVQPVSRHEPFDPLSSQPTIQTSFIRLPDEKMIITHQVTARNPARGSALLRPPLKIPNEDLGKESALPQSATTTTNSQPGAGSGQDLSTFVDGWPPLPAAESLENNPPVGTNLEGSPSPGDASLATGSASSNNDVVATEDDDLDRVYVTSDTNKPFRIDDLGGFDPEEDFDDAAKDLEVVASDESSLKAPNDSAVIKHDKLGRKRGFNQRRENHEAANHESQEAGTTHRDNEPINGNTMKNEQQSQQSGSSEVSFNDPETDMMYEDASETDEVTFGQDDPYQTDLEAEMRQQEYDKLSSSSSSSRPTARQTNDLQQPNMSGSLNVVVDSGSGPPSTNVAAPTNPEAGEADEDDVDAELDHEYRPEPSTRQQESMAAAAAASAAIRSEASNRRPRSEIDDEGAWVNDGVDEMDIPSQTHQNSVLDKAEQREEAAKRAADELDAANNNNNNNNNNKQEPDRDDSSTESGQTNDNGEESIRMPNADYLKNDFVEDDSGYAA